MKRWKIIRMLMPFLYILLCAPDPGSGPMNLVSECLEARCRVHVWIRHSAGLRGVCTGRIVAFDKHLNIVRTRAT